MKTKELTTQNQALTQTIPQNIWEALRQPTPRKFIKQRQGAGGRSFDYVEAGYVKDLLNKTFNSWSFTIVDKQVGNTQIWVQGRLTVQVPVTQPDGTIQFVEIVKEQFGGASIKKSRTDGTPIDIGNDLKAAASDALKKCASEWGVASDIYWGEVDNLEPMEMPAQEPAERTGKPSDKQMGLIYALMKEQHLEKELVCSWVKINSFSEMTYEQGQEVIKILQNRDMF